MRARHKRGVKERNLCEEYEWHHAASNPIGLTSWIWKGCVRHWKPQVMGDRQPCSLVLIKGWKKEQVRQCLGFCTAYFQSWLVFKSAVQNPKHCPTCYLFSSLSPNLFLGFFITCTHTVEWVFNVLPGLGDFGRQVALGVEMLRRGRRAGVALGRENGDRDKEWRNQMLIEWDISFKNGFGTQRLSPNTAPRPRISNWRQSMLRMTLQPDSVRP